MNDVARKPMCNVILLSRVRIDYFIYWKAELGPSVLANRVGLGTNMQVSNT